MTTTNITNFRKNAFDYVEQTIKYNQPINITSMCTVFAESEIVSLLAKGDGIQAVYGPKADVLKSDINDIL